jgi:putative ATPase
MLEGGADPRYLARRLVRIASEDVGLADPAALQLAVAGFAAVEKLGLPECNLALAEVALYLAAAPKSNAAYRAWDAARQDVIHQENPPVPMQLRNAVTPVLAELGYGEGYRYAHDEPEGVAAISCLPEALAGRRYYEPSDRGFERRLAELLEAARAARNKEG